MLTTRSSSTGPRELIENSTPHATARPPRRRVLRLILLGTGLVWASGWSAFVALSAAGEDWRARLVALAFSVGVLGPVVLASQCPRLGGLVLVAMGAWAWRFCDSRAAMVGLAIPAIGLGAALVVVGIADVRRARRLS